MIVNGELFYGNCAAKKSSNLTSFDVSVSVKFRNHFQKKQGDELIVEIIDFELNKIMDS